MENKTVENEIEGFITVRVKMNRGYGHSHKDLPEIITRALCKEFGVEDNVSVTLQSGSTITKA